MVKKIKQILKFFIVSGLLIFFLYLAFKDIDFNKLIEELLKTNYILAVLGMFVGLVIGSLIRAERWRYFLYPEKKNIKFGDLFSGVMIGYFVNAIIPRGGEVSRPFLLAQKEGISKAFTLGTIVVERIFDMLSMFFVFGLCLFFYRNKIQEAFGKYDIENISLFFSLGLLFLVIIAVILLINIEKTEYFLEKFASRLLPKKYREKFQKALLSLLNSFSFIKYKENYFKIFLLTVLLWLDYAFSTYLFINAFSDPTMKSLNFLDANVVLTLTAFAQTIPLPGNSAGSYHFFVKTTFVVIYGVMSETAMAYATISHLLTFMGILIIGFYYSIKENYKFSFKLNKSAQ